MRNEIANALYDATNMHLTWDQCLDRATIVAQGIHLDKKQSTDADSWHEYFKAVLPEAYHRAQKFMEETGQPISMRTIAGEAGDLADMALEEYKERWPDDS